MKSPHCLIIILLPSVLLMARSASSADEGAQAEYAKLSSEDVALRLRSAEEVPRAFYELWRRSRTTESTEKDEGFETFCDTRLNPTVVVCPQRNAKPPIFVILYDHPSISSHSRKKPARKRSLIDVYNSAGRQINPFEGNDILEGVIADLNGDGLMDRADVTNYGLEGVDNLQVLEVSEIQEKAVPLLSVVINWDHVEWGFRIVDGDKDGTSDIEVGPITDEGIRTKAAWKWDSAKNVYVGPSGTPGDHYRVVDGAQLWKELERLKAEKVKFPKEPVSPTEDLPSGGALAKPFTQARDAYKYQSLKDASNGEILRFMSEAKDEFEQESGQIIPDQTPKDFWTLPPREGALALLKANQSKDSRARYKISDANQNAPDRCTIAFSSASARCYNAVDAHFFLRVDPHDSYLVFTQSWSGGLVFYNPVHDQPAFDFRFCAVPYEDALQIAQVIWCLGRAELSNPRALYRGGFSSSSADGSAELLFQTEGYPPLEKAGTTWAAHLSERWDGEMHDEAILNFSSYLISNVLPEHLGPEWSKFNPKFNQSILARQNSSPQYSEQEQQRLASIAAKLLHWFSLQQDRVSLANVADAASYCGLFVAADQADQLRHIAATLPKPVADPRTKEVIEAELDALPLPSKVDDLKKRLETSRALLAELRRKDFPSALDRLRDNVALALRQIAAGNNVDELFGWATSRSEGSQWALQRLAQLDPTRHADTLEWWIRNSKDSTSQSFFDALQKSDSSRALAVARGVLPDPKNPLTVPAFLLLQKEGQLKDEDRWIEALLSILLEPKSGWHERWDVINALVPTSEPMRFRQPVIDEALVEIFEPGRADDRINFTLSAACRALARRGRVERFDDIAKQFKQSDDPSIRHEILGALSHLEQTAPEKLGSRLSSIVEPHLVQTSLMMTEILWAIWASDLRDLSADLERISTHDPTEYEDKKAASYGGDPSPVVGQFHLARKIVAIWTEQDPLTRAKLLLALSATESYHFVYDSSPERRSRLETEFSELASKLSPTEKEQLNAFLEHLLAESTKGNDEAAQLNNEGVMKVMDLARSLMQLPAGPRGK